MFAFFSIAMIGLLLLELAAVIAFVIFAWKAFRALWRQAERAGPVHRIAVLCLLAGIIALPVIGWNQLVWNNHKARIPAPLAIGSIEYEREQVFGVGFMPGDNETGFVVYRLTPESSAWALKQGAGLAAVLSRNAQEWRATPVGRSGAARSGKMVLGGGSRDG